MSAHVYLIIELPSRSAWKERMLPHPRSKEIEESAPMSPSCDLWPTTRAATVLSPVLSPAHPSEVTGAVLLTLVNQFTKFFSNISRPTYNHSVANTLPCHAATALPWLGLTALARVCFHIYRPDLSRYSTIGGCIGNDSDHVKQSSSCRTFCRVKKKRGVQAGPSDIPTLCLACAQNERAAASECRFKGERQHSMGRV